MSQETFTTYGQEKEETAEWTLKHTVLNSWDDKIPPLNLWNWNISWRWHDLNQEFDNKYRLQYYCVMEIRSSADWPGVERQLRSLISLVDYNPDVVKIQRNIADMVSELSRAEVEARRLKNTRYLEPYLRDINTAINNLEKWILMLQLSQ